MLKVAIVGVGAWGKNLVRNFHLLSGVDPAWCCDSDPEKLDAILKDYPGMRATSRFEDILTDDSIRAVIIASPAATHHDLAIAALEGGKHVYVEKPLALSAADAEAIAALADKKNLKLMVGHLLLYHPAVRHLKSLVDAGDLGDVFYINSQRVNLGKVRRDENALWSLAPHDVSVILHLLGCMPDSVSAHGESYIRQGVEDVVFLNMKFPDRRMAELQVSWLDPHKVRQIKVVGEKKMAIFDDMESSEKLKIFSKGADGRGYESYGDSLAVRFGDIKIPNINMSEPLRAECRHFADCILEDRRPLTDGANGVRVVKVLEAAQQSMRQGGAPVKPAGRTEAKFI
jgi:predicted dehydrogenase